LFVLLHIPRKLRVSPLNLESRLERLPESFE
jgi:hypothetical protein